MKLADANMIVAKALNDIARFLVFDGEVACIIINAQQMIDLAVLGAVLAALVDEIDSFLARFEIAQGLGLEAKMKFLASFVREFGDVIDRFPDIVAHGPDLGRGGDKFLVGAWDGADAGFDSSGGELREEIEKAVGVIHAERGSPVGQIDLFLDAGAVEGGVGKAVDSKNVAIFGLEPFLKGEQGRGLGKLARGCIAQAQADGIRGAGGNAIADGEGMRFNSAKGLGP